MYYVYILKFHNNQLYIDYTKDIQNRIKKYSAGYANATKNLLPIKLIQYNCLNNKYLAYNFVKYLKSSSGRVFTNKRLA